MSDSKTRTYKIVSKAMLEKIQQESSNEELLEEIRLEFLQNKERARVIQNYFPEPKKSTDKKQTDGHKNNQISKLSLKAKPKFIQHYETCDLCFKQIPSEVYKTHFEKTCPKRPKYFTAKIGWEGQDLDEIPQIAKITDRKKKSKISELKNEIQNLRRQLNSTDSKKKPYSILKLRAAIQVKIGTLDRFIGTESNKSENSSNLDYKSDAFNGNKPKSGKKYKNCPNCLIPVLEKNYNHHISLKCPKKPQIDENGIQPELENVAISIENLSWTLLPKGDWLFEKLTTHFKQLNSLSQWKNKTFDETRFKKIEKTLRPNKCFVGKGEFEGYIAYCFGWTNTIVLECPIYGNAIYLIRRGKYSWQEIAKVSKYEARTDHYDQVKVINHSDSWLERLEQNLRSGF